MKEIKEKLNGLDLFSGIGGITKALEEWVKPVAYCENDRYCQGVLLSRMATGDLQNAPIWDDVQTLDGFQFKGDCEIIYGGFPCQDISVANTSGMGLEGKRSGLFFEIERLVREIRPRFVFLENVPAIRTRGGSVVGARLADAGYDCRWITLSASEVGANHKRKRWWLLAYANINRKEWDKPKNRERRGTLETSENVEDTRCEYGQGDEQDRTNKKQDGKKDASQSKRSGAVPGSTWWSVEPNVGRVAHGIPFRVDRLRGLGNAVVPAQAREAFKILMGLK